MTAIEEVQAMLNAWDTGHNVWTIEMGGLGPGYEQTIQICMIEICRAAIKEPRKADETDEQYVERFNALTDKVIHKIDAMCGGFSGAQVGAATNLAYHFVTKGRIQVFKAYKEHNPDTYDDRHIQISKFWPKAP